MATIARTPAAAAVAVLLLGFAAVAHAQDQTTPTQAADTPAPFTRGGADLSRTLWFASADLPPTATVDQIRASSARTTPTATLRTDPGSSGTLFALFEVAAPPTSGAALTIGDIDGADETWFNGTLIGSTRGWGVTDHGIPRVYPVEQKLIRTGINVLAVRMSGTFGAGTFGIRREPITFGFVPVPPVTRPWAASSSGGGVPGISENDARKAIAASDPGSTSTAPVLRKRPGFGRFGYLIHDGLPALSEISPTRVSNRGGPRFDVSLDRVESLEIARGDGEPGIDGWHKLVRVKGPCSGQPVTYTMLQHLWYPGGILTLERGTSLQLRVRFPGGKGASLPLTDAEAAAVSPALANPSFTAFVFHELGPGTAPAVLAVTNGAANVTQAEGHIDVTVSRAEDGKPAKVHIFFPLGMGRADLTSAKPARFLDTASAVDPGAAPEDTVRRWLRLGLNEPTGADEYAQVRTQDGIVRIYQVARHAAPEGVAIGDPYLFPPPQVPFARRELKYPVVCPETTATGS